MSATRSPSREDERQDGEPRSHRTLTTVGALGSAAGTFVLGVLNYSGAEGSPVAYVVGGVLLIATFVASVVGVLKGLWPAASRRRRFAYVAGLVVCTAGLVVVGLVTRVVAPLPTMPGTTDVAVVGYLAPTSEQQDEYDDLADALAGTLVPGADGEVRDYSARVDAPLEGLERTPGDGDLDEWVEDFQRETRAELVVAGHAVSAGPGQVEVRTLAYVPVRMANDAPELVGWFPLDERLVDRSLSSARSRAAFLAGVAGEFDGLAQFLVGLDAWQAGYPEDAVAALEEVAGRTDRTSTLHDLSRLFLGHARETLALGADVPERRRLLQTAAQDYLTIDPTSPIHDRARLSVATNTFLVAREGGCDEDEAGALAESSAVLAQVAGDPAVPELVRRKAQVNRAQVELCRVDAGVATAAAELDGVLGELATFDVPEDDVGSLSARVKALALSVDAVWAERQGRVAEAVDTLAEALELDPAFERQALWRGLRSAWLLRECRVEEGRADQDAALRQLEAAVDQGRLPEQQREVWSRAFAQDLQDALGRCPGAGG